MATQQQAILDTLAAIPDALLPARIAAADRAEARTKAQAANAQAAHYRAWSRAVLLHYEADRRAGRVKEGK